MEDHIDRVQEATVAILMMILMEIWLMLGMGIGMMRDTGVGILMNGIAEVPIKMTVTVLVVIMVTSLGQEVGVLIDIQTVPLEMMIVNHLGILSFRLALLLHSYLLCI